MFHFVCVRSSVRPHSNVKHMFNLFIISRRRSTEINAISQYFLPIVKRNKKKLPFFPIIFSIFSPLSESEVSFACDTFLCAPQSTQRIDVCSLSLFLDNWQIESEQMNLNWFVEILNCRARFIFSFSCPVFLSPNARKFVIYFISPNRMWKMLFQFRFRPLVENIKKKNEEERSDTSMHLRSLWSEQ